MIFHCQLQLPGCQLQNISYSCLLTKLLSEQLNIFYLELTWEPHIRNLKIKCMKAVDILKVLIHINWEGGGGAADRKHLLQLHNLLIVSRLSYDSEIYSSATKPRLNTLNALHHAGIRIATGAFRSSPIQSLPRAQYFVVVGGLAFCKDDLGCAR